MPEIDQSILQRLTGIDIDNTNIEPKRYTWLVFGHILSKCLRSGPDIGALGDFGCEDACIVLNHLIERRLSGDLICGIRPSFEVTLAKRTPFGISLFIEVADC